MSVQLSVHATGDMMNMPYVLIGPKQAKAIVALAGEEDERDAEIIKLKAALKAQADAHAARTCELHNKIAALEKELAQAIQSLHAEMLDLRQEKAAQPTAQGDSRWEMKHLPEPIPTGDGGCDLQVKAFQLTPTDNPVKTILCVTPTGEVDVAYGESAEVYKQTLMHAGKAIAQLKAELAAEREKSANTDRAIEWATKGVEQIVTERDAARSQVAALEKELAEAKTDARRWRALIGSARLRPLGCAGLSKDQDGYAHIGFEAWTMYPGDHTKENSIGVEWLTAYVDIAAAKLAEAGQVMSEQNIKDTAC